MFRSRCGCQLGTAEDEAAVRMLNDLDRRWFIAVGRREGFIPEDFLPMFPYVGRRKIVDTDFYEVYYATVADAFDAEVKRGGTVLNTARLEGREVKNLAEQIAMIRRHGPDRKKWPDVVSVQVGLPDVMDAIDYLMTGREPPWFRGKSAPPQRQQQTQYR